ncbi:MAG: mechanosensitive ion channel family protein [Proteobacteria bacterium]|nr:MAG: mechanosensitive ion channel family protein [Pseudomonadota bacterium]
MNFSHPRRLQFARSVGSVIRVPLLVFVLIGITRAAGDFLPIPEKRIDTFEKWMGVALILTLTWAASRVAGSLLQSPKLDQKLSSSLQTLLIKIARFMIFSLGTLVALGHLGVSITPILASLGVGSIAIALALQDTLGNLFSGFYLLIDQPFLVGDQVKLESGAEGKVKLVGWRSTQIELGTASLLVVPNSKLSSSMVTNYSRPIREVGLSVIVQISYDSDLARAEEIALDVATEVSQQTDYVPENHVPNVRINGFLDLGIQVSINTRAKSFEHQAMIRHLILGKIKTRFDAEKISFASLPTAASSGRKS